MMIDYVLGFIYDKLGNIALIKKTKPSWQAGMLNGIGGKIEEDESTLAAMIREFQEETGVLHADWQMFSGSHGHDWSMYNFRSQVDDLYALGLKTTTEEEVVIVNLGDMNMQGRVGDYTVLPDAMYMIPMVMNSSPPCVLEY